MVVTILAAEARFINLNQVKLKNALIIPGIICLSTILFCCSGNQQTAVKNTDSTVTAKKETHQPDSLFATESDNIEDTVKEVPVTDTIKTIRENFKRINSISNWTQKETRATEQTAEGGEATYYYMDGKLEKIITQNYGETFQQLTEYYLLDGKLSFVFEKTLKYNRPLYYDSTAMKENNDTETFDLNKAIPSKTRSYFFNSRLFYQLSQTKNEATVINNNLKEEQQRLKISFDELIQLLSKK